jgi:hypothetical protein
MEDQHTSSPLFKGRYHPSQSFTKSQQLTNAEANEGVNTFSGTDIQVYIHYPGLYTKQQLQASILQRANPTTKDPQSLYTKLGSLQYLSWGFTRTKSLVSHLGRAVGKGFTRGTRIVTGVMSFLQIDRTAFSPLYNNDIHSTQKDVSPYRNIDSPDSLPPFNLFITYVNEKGVSSYRIIKHVEIVQGQGTDSVDDVNPIESYSFVALSITPLMPLSASRSRPIDNMGQSTFSIGNIVSKSNSGQSVQTTALGTDLFNTLLNTEESENSSVFNPVSVVSSTQPLDTPITSVVVSGSPGLAIPIPSDIDITVT